MITDSLSQRRQRNFMLLAMYMILSLCAGGIYRGYRNALQNEYLKDGLSMSQVVNSLQYNTHIGMFGVFLFWVWVVAIVIATYFEPQMSDAIIRFVRRK